MWRDKVKPSNQPEHLLNISAQELCWPRGVSPALRMNTDPSSIHTTSSSDSPARPGCSEMLHDWTICSGGQILKTLFYPSPVSLCLVSLCPV